MNREITSRFLGVAGTLILGGTAGGQSVELVQEFNPAGRGSGPYSVTSFAGALYFQADAGVAGRELMKYDGTSVSLAADIHPTGSASPSELTVSGGVLYFTADDGLNGRRLWSFDGSTATLADTNQFAASPQELISFDDTLYFRGVRFGHIGIELFRYDGSDLTFIDILPGTGSSFPQHFTEFDGALYFNAAGALGQGSELWRYDGVTVSKAGPEIRIGSGSAPAWFAEHDGQLYFAANDGVHGNELWRFDGVSSSLVADINAGGEYSSSNPSSLMSYNGDLYFCATDGSANGNELWRYDGTTAEMVANINPNPPGPGGDDFEADSNPFELTVHDGLLYFHADDGARGRELWACDGLSCYLVEDIRSIDQDGSNLSGLQVVNGELYLIADSGAGFGLELYRVLPPGEARIPNGDFESGGLLPWTLTGAGAVVGGGAFDPPLVPATGQLMGYITTLNNEGAEDFGFFDESPDLDGNGVRETEYSALRISFTVTAPSTVSVDLDFLTDELLPGNLPDAGDADIFGLTNGGIRTGPYLLLCAMAPTDESYSGVAEPLTSGDFVGEGFEESNFGVFPGIPDASRFQGHTGFRHYEFPVEPGVHTWTFFVADSHTDGVASAMLIDNLRLSARGTSSAAAVPCVVNFGVISFAPALDLNGAGSNVDSIAFWEAPDPADTLMFVTGKSNDVVEVWKFPFAGNEQPAIPFTTNVNGVVVDQETDTLYVSDRIVSVFNLPGLTLQDTFGNGILGVGENNLDILHQTGGQTIIYVSDDHSVHRFDAATKSHLGAFAPPVSSIETVLADDFYQRVYVPEEQGPEGNPGVFAYTPDGTPYEMNGTNRFGNNGEFDSDEEGALLYTFPSSGEGDHGTGFIVVSDQKADQTDFEFFDRQTWAHLGTLRLDGVSNTDGIASTQKALPGFPLGLFAAIDDDTSTVLLGWHTILAAIVTPYELWALDHGLVSGINDGPEDDPDGDGCANFKEFATGGDPRHVSGNRSGRATIADIDGADHFSFTFPVRSGAVFTGSGSPSSTVDGVVYSVAGTVDLLNYGEDVVEVVPALDDGLPALGSGWRYRTFRLSKNISDSRAGFIRLLLEPAP